VSVGIPRPLSANRIDAVRAQRFYAAGWWRPDRTFLDDFLERSESSPDQVAVVADAGALGRHTLSYRQLRTAVDRIAHGLLDVGVGPGDVVSFQIPNWWQFPALALACSRIGAVSNPIAPILRSRETSFALGALGTKVFVVPGVVRNHDYTAMAAELLPALEAPPLLFTLGEAVDGVAASFAKQFLSAPRPPTADLHALRPEPNDVAQVQFTSGTTGKPKGVVHTYNTLYASYRGIVDVLQLNERDVVQVISTMAHQTGFLNGCVMPLAEGMKVVYQDAWDADTMLDLIRDEGVTYTSGATPFMIDLCAAAERTGLDVPTLKYFRSGGSAVPAHVAERVRAALDAQVILSWGMTENGVCTISRRDDSPEDIAASDGYPLPWVELRTTPVDELADLRADEGLLWMRSASQCVDYVPDHDLYARSFDDDGWFDTGDLARIYKDGSVRITGRVKDMVIRGGENVPVVEVEHALLAHPAIAEVAVVGIPDERLGERACAVVVTAPGASVPLELIQEQLRSIGMATQFWPEYVLVRDQLPRSAAGKVRKAELRADVLKDLQSRAIERRP
jgi:cyclohexanecarboxylate-CoA ligase